MSRFERWLWHRASAIEFMLVLGLAGVTLFFGLLALLAIVF